MTYDQFEELVAEMERIEFGSLENIELNFDPEDPRLVQSLSLEEKRPLRMFARYVRNKGPLRFDILKIQNGLPMFGEQRLDEHRVKHLKFNRKGA